MSYQREETHIGKLSRQCLEDSERWFGDSGRTHGVPGLVHHSLAMAGEVGEFCNIMKKVDRGSLDLRDAVVRNNLSMELTDVLVYVLNIAGLLGVDLDRTYAAVRGNNEKRFMAERAEREKRRVANV